MRPRILTPEGEIIKALMEGPLNPVQIVNRVRLGKSTVYNNLKDLEIEGWATRDGECYRVTAEGVRAYISEVLPEDVEVGGLVGSC